MPAYLSDEPIAATCCIDPNCSLASTIFTVLDMDVSQTCFFVDPLQLWHRYSPGTYGLKTMLEMDSEIK